MVGWVYPAATPEREWKDPENRSRTWIEGIGLNINRLIDMALRPLQFVAFFLSGFVRRDDSTWVFGSWSGKLAGDNAGAFFEYVAGLAEGPSCVWISADPQIVRELRSRGLPAERRSSIAGWGTCARAGVYVFDGLTNDINHWVSRGAKKVLLRHGVGMKRIERAIDNPSHHLFKLFHGKWWQRLFWSISIPWHLTRPDWCIATSPEHARQAVRFFGIEPNQVWITGFPRHDKLLQGERPDGAAEVVARAMESSPRPSFLYMPTFRDQSRPVVTLWDELNREADRANVDIYVKLHFVDFHRGAMPSPSERGNWKRLTWIDPALEATDLYRSATGLITDYSSVAFDMMLLGKPIIYFIPDLKSFVSDRSLLYPIDEVTPGPKCRTFRELGDALAGAAESGVGLWQDQYEAVAVHFHTYRDGQSCPRVYGMLIGELGPPIVAVADADASRLPAESESQYG